MKENSVQPNTTKFTSHSVNMTDRKKIVMTGVSKVDCASDTEIVLTTCMGKLVVCGSDLKLGKFDESDGSLTLGGNIASVKYAETKPPLLKRIFK